MDRKWAGRGAIDTGVAVLRRKRESEWILKLRTVYPYGLNDRVDMFSHDNYASKINCKIGEDMVGKLFPKLPRNFNRNSQQRHRNRKHNNNVNYDIFIKQLEYWVNNDLANASNNIRVALYSIKKKHLKLIANYINDYLNTKDSNFLYLPWYLMALDIIECKLFKELPVISKRPLPKYRCNISFCNKALDFINLPQILRSDDVLKNCPSYLDQSDLPMIVYTLNKPIRSKIFNYHKFVQELDIDKFVNDNTSIPCCCNEFDPSLVDSHHKHIITGNLNIINNNKLRKLISKGPKYREPEKIDWDMARKQIVVGIDEYLNKVAEDKGLNKAYFSEWKNVVMNSVDGKIDTLKTRITPRNTCSVLKDNNADENLKFLQSKFVIVPIDKAANNIAFICKQFYASVIANELDLYKENINSPTYDLVSNININNIINEHKTYLNNMKINLCENMEVLPLIYWIPKMHKNPTSFRFIIASPRCSLKPLSKDLTSIFKLFYRKVERYYTKSRIWSGLKQFWVIQNNKPVIDDINKISRRKAAKTVSTFDFSTLYTKIPHNKLISVLNNIIDFAFKGGTRDYISVSNSQAYWVKSSSSGKGTTYSKHQIREALTYLINNCYFTVGSKLFKQIIGIPMGSDPAPFFANLFLFHYEAEWIKSMKNTNYGKAKKFSYVFRFIDDLLAINDGEEFLNNFLDIYPPELELKKENKNNNEATFLDLHLSINDSQITTQLYDKRNYFHFDIVRFPYKSSTIPSKMFFSTISAEILRICRANSLVESFLETSRVLLLRMKKQGADNHGIKAVLKKMFNRHQEEFHKFQVNIETLINRLLV